ncbi:MAG: DUF3592 domain-containing protein [Cyanobacteria bacterium SZAS LIN-2]|nr:DUF3592 domain-containing protein [Cyanobacteria bacterium SZAS LIN-2]
MITKQTLILWFIAAATLGLITFGNDPYRYVQLSARGIETNATVLSLKPLEHHTYTFRFSVKGNSYEGVGYIDDANTRKVGDSVRILYAPDRPTLNADCKSRNEARKRLVRSLPGIALMLLVLPSIFVLLVRKWSAERAKVRQQK